MRLINNIKTKILAASAILFSVFAHTAAFAQTSADAAGAAKVDMDPIYRSISFYVLLFLLLCLFIGIIGKALKIYELTREVQGKPVGINWNIVNGFLCLLILIVGLYGVYWEYTVQGNMLLPEAASEDGKRIDEMFTLTLYITTAVFLLTHIALFGFSYLYRNTGKRKAYFYPHNNTLEMIWTVVPALVLTVMVLMGFLTWRAIFNKIDDPKNMPIDIEITGQQFQWDVRYPGADGKVGVKNHKLIDPINLLGIDFTDKATWDDQMASDTIMMPVNKPIRFILTSKDVLHGFYLPHFRVQLFTVPGMTSVYQITPTITTKEMIRKTKDPKFNYVLLCSQLCGAGHYNMQRLVMVVTQAEYDAWVKRLPKYINNDLRKKFNLPLEADPTTTVPDSAVIATAAQTNLTALK